LFGTGAWWLWTHLSSRRPQHRFNEPCVLKEFAPQVQGTYGLHKAEELFEREAGVLYKVQHPQIPQFRELFRVKQGKQRALYFWYKICGGTNYHALLDARKRQGLRFNEAEVTQLMLQICQFWSISTRWV
jgi:serine/threonine-protein kinase